MKYEGKDEFGRDVYSQHFPPGTLKYLALAVLATAVAIWEFKTMTMGHALVRLISKVTG